MADLFAKKTMESLMEEAHEHGSHSLERTLGPVSLTMLGIGAVIGAGIFVLSGIGARTAGPDTRSSQSASAAANSDLILAGMSAARRLARRRLTS